MISQEIVNGQPPKAEAVLELSMMSSKRKDDLVLEVDELLDVAGIPGDVADIIPRLKSYIARHDIGMRHFLQQSIRDLEVQAEALDELTRKMRGLR